MLASGSIQTETSSIPVRAAAATSRIRDRKRLYSTDARSPPAPSSRSALRDPHPVGWGRDESVGFSHWRALDTAAHLVWIRQVGHKKRNGVSDVRDALSVCP